MLNFTAAVDVPMGKTDIIVIAAVAVIMIGAVFCVRGFFKK